MKLVESKFWINNECPTVKENQHIYKMFLKTINESWKCLKGELTENDYENTIKEIFESFLEEDFKRAIGINTSFKRVFLTNLALSMDINDKIYLIIKFIELIKESRYSNMFEDKGIIIKFDLIEKIDFIYLFNSKLIYKESAEENIFFFLYNYIKERINIYEKLSNKEKLIFLCKKSKVKIDFTNKRNSYAYNSSLIVIGKDVDIEKLVLFMERSNYYLVINVFNYFVYYVLFREYVKWKSLFGSYMKDEERRFKKNMIFNIYYMIDLLKPNKGRYLINKLKSIRCGTISRKVIDKEYIIFEIEKEAWRFIYYGEDFYDLGRKLEIGKKLKYNYTNDHIIW